VSEEPSDDELLEAWRGGDRRAAAELIHRYSDDLLRFFRAKVGGDAEDLIQQTLLGCLHATRDRAAVTSFRAYLCGVARHRLIDHIRRTLQAASDPLEFSLADVGNSPSVELARGEEQRILLDALRRIPLDLQIILELYYWERMSASELSSVLEVPEGTIRSRIRRAKMLLKHQIEALATSPLQRDRTLEDLKDRVRAVGDTLD